MDDRSDVLDAHGREPYALLTQAQAESVRQRNDADLSRETVTERYNSRVIRPERILTLLASLRRSQSWLATESGVRIATISDILHGRSQPRRTTIAAIARALGVPPSEITDTPREDAAPSVSQQLSSSDGIQSHLTELYRRCLDQQATIIDLQHQIYALSTRVEELESQAQTTQEGPRGAPASLRDVVTRLARLEAQTPTSADRTRSDDIASA
jgi:transcriptional regulator with XRE-family HTH domain